MKLRISRHLRNPEGTLSFIAEAPAFPSLGAIYASFKDMPESDAIRRREFRDFPHALFAIERAFLYIHEATPPASNYGDSILEFVHQ